MAKKQYRVQNWKQYNKYLVNRGKITFWFDEEKLRQWSSPSSSKPGRPQIYSDEAITCLLLIKAVFKLDFRKLQGFAESLKTLQHWPIDIPCYTQVCRRQKTLVVDLPRISKGESVHAIFDSTGLKVFGEGEWKVRQHGYSKRRTWRKLHLGIDEKTGEIIARELTTNDIADNEVFPNLLDQIKETIFCVSADGAYDKNNCYKAIDERGVQANIPPRRDAALRQHGNCKGPPLTRDENIRAIRQIGRAAWKKQVGYHRRSLSETAMFRFKTLFGNTLSNRIFEHQVTEAFIKCNAMNRMTHLGMPKSVST